MPPRQRHHHRRKDDDAYEDYELDGDRVPLERFRRRIFLDGGRIAGITAAGERLPDHLAGLIDTGGTLNLSREQVPEVSLALTAANYRLLGEERLHLGTVVEWGDLTFRIAAIDDDGLTHTITARDALWRRARRKRGHDDMDRDSSPTEFLARRFRRMNIEFVGQPSHKRRLVGMKQKESLPKAATRLAEELGYALFTVAGVVYFGKPTWLMAHGARIIISPEDVGGVLRTRPMVRLSVDNEKRGREVTLELEPEAGDRVRPGMTLEARDIPIIDEEPYLVDTVTIPLNGADPVTVNASTPINPEPQPPERRGSDGATASGGSVEGALKPRSYAGEKLGPEQLRNVEVIFTVGRANHVPARGIVIALMAAMVESRLINVDYGDRDSLGLFQQRAAWGSRKQRMNPRTSALMFYTGGHGGQPGLLDHAGWQNMGLGEAAQDVQVSAYPDRYAAYADMAQALVDALQEAAARARKKARSSGGGGPDGSRAVWPTTAHSISTPYKQPGSWEAGYHTGVDIDGDYGDPVWSPISGRVVHAGSFGDYGNTVIVRGARQPGGDRADVMLCHLQSIAAKVGQDVRPHTRVGKVGNTGRSFGAHLHVEVRPVGGDYGDDLNPMPWVGR